MRLVTRRVFLRLITEVMFYDEIIPLLVANYGSDNNGGDGMATNHVGRGGKRGLFVVNQIQTRHHLRNKVSANLGKKPPELSS